MGENPDDPYCTHVVVSGFFDSALSDIDRQAAKAAMWRQHPVMRGWDGKVPGHKFTFWALRVDDMWVRDGKTARNFHYDDSHCEHVPNTVVKTFGWSQA